MARQVPVGWEVAAGRRSFSAVPFSHPQRQIEIVLQFLLVILDLIHFVYVINYIAHFEKASLFLRVGKYDECIESCNNTIMLNPDIIDAYRLLGYAQLQKGDKEAGRKNLQKAIDMGDENAKVILEKYL